MKICKTHSGKEFKLRDGKNGPFYSHVDSGTLETGFTYHNVDVDKIATEIAPEQPNDLTREKVEEVFSNGNDIPGKVRSLFIQSRIIKQGLTLITPDEFKALKQLVDVAITGNPPTEQTED